MYYIAYGSNINLEQMKYRCPNSKVIGKGIVKYWKLYFNLHADIRYTGNEGDVVPVLIWDIADEDWTALDRYEGYPKYYITDVIETEFLNSNDEVYKTEKCIAYIMTNERGAGFAMPEEYYIQTIAKGYLENNIDLEYLYEALDYSNRNRIGLIEYYYNKGLI